MIFPALIHQKQTVKTLYTFTVAKCCVEMSRMTRLYRTVSCTFLVADDATGKNDSQFDLRTLDKEGNPHKFNICTPTPLYRERKREREREKEGGREMLSVQDAIFPHVSRLRGLILLR